MPSLANPLVGRIAKDLVYRPSWAAQKSPSHLVLAFSPYRRTADTSWCIASRCACRCNRCCLPSLVNPSDGRIAQDLVHGPPWAAQKSPSHLFLAFSPHHRPSDAPRCIWNRCACRCNRRRLSSLPNPSDGRIAKDLVYRPSWAAHKLPAHLPLVFARRCHRPAPSS